MEEYYVYVSSYTNEPNEGISVFNLEPFTGKLTLKKVIGGGDCPSYIAFHPTGELLYAVHRLQEYAGEKGGAVSAYRVERDTGDLTLLNRASSKGLGPCHISVDRTGKCVLIVNYYSGSVAVFTLRSDGALDTMSDFHLHSGSSIHPTRQQSPHPHCILSDPTNQFACVVDLGLDKLFVYRLDPDGAKLSLEYTVDFEAGTGPRHIDFHPNGKFAYVVNELSSTITVFTFDGSSGKFAAQQTVPTLKGNTEKANHCAAIHVHPSGRFVYSSNRGDDSIAIHRVDPETGCLELLDTISTQGRIPRTFDIDPTGTMLIVANQESESLTVFKIDPGTGGLKLISGPVAVRQPSCVRIVSMA